MLDGFGSASNYLPRLQLHFLPACEHNVAAHRRQTPPR
jgi:hypothetical protein